MGAIDTTFNTTGLVVTKTQTITDIARAGAIEATGRLLTVGYSWNGSKFDTALGPLQY